MNAGSSHLIFISTNILAKLFRKCDGRFGGKIYLWSKVLLAARAASFEPALQAVTPGGILISRLGKKVRGHEW
jgi:hypothetical protein